MKWKTFGQIAILLVIASVLFYIVPQFLEKVKADNIKAKITKAKSMGEHKVATKPIDENLWILPGDFKWSMSRKEVIKRISQLDSYAQKKEFFAGQILRYTTIKGKHLVNFFFTSDNELSYILASINGGTLIHEAFAEAKMGKPDIVNEQRNEKIWTSEDGVEMLMIRTSEGIISYSNKVITDYEEIGKIMSRISTEEKDFFKM